MEETREWRLLPASHPDVPVLLVSAVFGPASYAVYVTDLANVWCEALDRRDICMRGFKENTSIDPSYDNEQMTVFLSKIRSVFDPDHVDHASARLSLASTADGNGLKLHITSQLPQGLQPLQWPMVLKRCPRESIASELVVPLLQDREVHRKATADLVEMLQEKDAVINKLVDKLEALGAGLETVFPSLAGRRKLAREAAAKRVKGLVPFGAKQFQKQHSKPANNNPDDGDSADNIVRSLLGDGHDLKCQARAPSKTTPNLDSWWVELGTGAGLPLKLTETKKKVVVIEDTPTKPIRIAEDDSFESPEKVAALTSSPVPAPAKKKPLEAAEDAPPSQEPAPAPSQTLPQRSGVRGRLGAIGKKKTTETVPKPDPEPEPEKESEPKPEPVPKATASSDPVNDTDGTMPDAPDDESTADEASPPSPVKAPPPKRKIGGIGKKKASEPPSTAEEPPIRSPSPVTVPPLPASTEPELSSVKNPPPKRTIGKIGKIGKSSSQEPKVEPSSQPTAIDAPELPPKETKPPARVAPSALKRNEIVQQAVEKHAAPVRKKRKF